MTNVSDNEARLKRARMRSMRRGIKEMDLILVAYCEARLTTMDPATLTQYESLLNENDQDLYQWVSGQAEAPETLQTMVADIRSVALLATGGVGLRG
ncbi:succinate dehydrogenase assembly factor 2 [Marinovum sp. 2_MG-2023]|uniref:FAD assembly factor SdhE n=1 Tax=unclassified Marinovum TaxID=2647166 RepID=UPI0026E41C66|nr:MULTISPECIES: succinate dehydrogenase assembly factor 2 [unclassified Marinovum]MDO6728700.1 succinate dehydrogenase assembly factor 2 [Marinovum sp. 2_MG-2023]MDO6777884.1 succinate dehydrogenase assembly factor 2 [Marinovum sp. 1_MG-2023]